MPNTQSVDVSYLLKHIITDQDENMLFIFDLDFYFYKKDGNILVINENIEKKQVLNLTLLMDEMGLPRDKDTTLATAWALLAGRSDGKYLEFA